METDRRKRWTLARIYIYIHIYIYIYIYAWKDQHGRAEQHIVDTEDGQTRRQINIQEDIIRLWSVRRWSCNMWASGENIDFSSWEKHINSYIQGGKTGVETETWPTCSTRQTPQTDGEADPTAGQRLRDSAPCAAEKICAAPYCTVVATRCEPDL